jgi:hypothetical protein
LLLDLAENKPDGRDDARKLQKAHDVHNVKSNEIATSRGSVSAGIYPASRPSSAGALYLPGVATRRNVFLR